MSEIWGRPIPSPYKSGAQKPSFFPRLRNLMATLTAYIFGTKQDIDNEPSALISTRGLLHRPKTTCTLVHKRLQIGPPFYPLNINCASKSISLPGFADGDQQMQLNQTLPNGGQYIELTICHRRVGVVSPKKLGAKNLLHLFDF